MEGLVSNRLGAVDILDGQVIALEALIADCIKAGVNRCGVSRGTDDAGRRQGIVCFVVAIGLEVAALGVGIDGEVVFKTVSRFEEYV